MKKKQQDTAEVKRLTVPEGYDGPMLDIRDLRVIYKTDLETVEAINGISLRIGKGKTFGLVGETGAGKTTTALSILRLLPHNTGRILNGEILFNGVNLLDEDEEVMRAVRGNLISMVFQDPMSALNPVYTVGDQIGEAVALHNPDFTKEQVEERVDEMLKLVGIMPSRKHDYPHQFSGGMKQRVVIAMALCCEPDRRRAHHGAGCDHSGAGAGHDPGTARPSGHLHADDHSRSGYCSSNLRRRRRDVRRRDHRIRHGGGYLSG